MAHRIDRQRLRPGVLLVLLLSACSSPALIGQWQPIGAPALYFSGVALPAEALDTGYPDVCREAQSEIQQQLNQRLPEALPALTFYSQRPARGTDYAELSMTLTACSLDSDQSGGSFRFYLSLGVTLELSVQGRRVMHHQYVVHEQAHSDTPLPLYEFTFVDPVSDTLRRFKGTQVLIPLPENLEPVHRAID